MAARFLEMTQAVLGAKHCLVVEGIHELLQIFESQVSMHLFGLVCVLLDSLVDAIFEILLYSTSQAGVTLIDGPLNFHEPAEACLDISRQNTRIIQVVAGDMEESSPCERINKRFDFDLRYIFIVIVSGRGLEAPDLILDPSSISAFPSSFGTLRG